MTHQDPMLAALAAPGNYLPADAPFDADQRQFLNGLLAGLAAAANAGGAQDAPAGTALTILYGSQSGTAESLAKNLKKHAATQGFDGRVTGLDAVTPADLSQMRHLLILAATFGEGEPTDNARAFHDALMAEDAPALPETLNFAVLGLGDSSYAGFNAAGRALDVRLAELGATRVADGVFCDVAYEDDFAAWKTAVFAAPAFAEAAGQAILPAAHSEPAALYDKARPFPATVLDVRRLSGPGEGKVVNHVEISLAGGGADLAYEAGDALGLWPSNCPGEVAAILGAAGLTGAERVTLRGEAMALRAALLSRLDLTTLTSAVREAWGAAEDAQVLDALRGGVVLGAQDLADALRPLQPRLYSISSSPLAHPGEVHLTVGEVRYDLHGEARKGCASTFLADRVSPGSTVGIYVQRAAHFHPPAPEVPVIMIGPGTGIAPFRAFLEERAATGANGDNWLFFGDRTATRDYLYEAEIEGWRASGLLSRLSLAWSRETGAPKTYVQHLIEKEGAEIWDWLERGACIYVCGDAARMAADVDAALRAVIAWHGAMDAEAAAAHLAALAREGRYRRDVY